MAKKYQLNAALRIANRSMGRMISWGLGPAGYHLLTVTGRKSGNRYSTPMALIEEDGNRWLVAPYGEVSWVFNARAAGEVTLTRGRTSQIFRIDVGDAGIRAVGLLWLVTTLGWVATGFGLIFLAPWWQWLTVAVALFSSVLCVLGLPEAKYGLLINLIVIGLLFLDGRFQWLPCA